MTNTGKWVIVIVVILLIIGAWWYMSHKSTGSYQVSPATSSASPSGQTQMASVASLDSDLSNVDANMKLLSNDSASADQAMKDQPVSQAQ